MARSVGTTVENNFVNGLITEATGLNFPENACTDTLNCIFHDNGKVSRRGNLRYEVGATWLGAYQPQTSAMTEYVWEAVGGDGDRNFLVRQIGQMLYFYKVQGEGSLSSQYFAAHWFTFVQGAEASGHMHQAAFAAGGGDLLVVHPYALPMAIRYDAINNTVKRVKNVTIKIRDFDVVEDGLGLTETTKKLGAAQNYNLQNQGWNPGRIEYFFKQKGFYPRHNEVWWMMKDAEENFDPKKLAGQTDRGRSRAPNGKWIVDALNIDRGKVAGIKKGLKPVTSGGRQPTAVEFFAGRAWYSGVQAEGYSNDVYFSQVIENDLSYQQCYQKNDPTSETAPDLLATDGGVVKILEAGAIIKLLSVDTYLLVFATNGIWAISGSTGAGFSATDYVVKRISNIGAINPHNFVDVNGVPIWWNTDGIYTIQANSSVGQIQVASLIDKKIKQVFEAIPAESKKYAKGAFNKYERIVQWVYRSTSANSHNYYRYQYDMVLNLNTVTGAFWQWKFAVDDTHQVNGILSLPGVGIDVVVDEVTTNAGEIITSGTATVPGPELSKTSYNIELFSSMFKYPTSNGGAAGAHSFADCLGESFYDWDAYDYESYFVSGYKIRGEGQRKFQTNYIWVFLDNQERGACYIQNIWDYTISPNTGRWSTKQKVDANNTLVGNFIRKLKMRGHGKVLQFKVSHVPGERFDIIGWSTFESANGSP